MEKDYKIEMKPTFWHVTLSQGCYSDYSEENIFFHANSEEEVWNFLCRYFKDRYNSNNYERKALIWNEKRFFIESEETEIDWDWHYGDALNVKIDRLNVIEFQR